MLLPLMLLAMSAAPAGAQDAPPPAQAGPELARIRHVYLLPMANGFDQYLATHLTRQGVLQVVADPARADAILTDQLGKPFEDKLHELYPEPKPAEEKPSQAEEPESAAPAPSLDLKVTPMDRASSFGRGKGTLFLVHRGSRNVVWSTYERPRRTVPDELNRAARRAAGELSQAVRKAAGPGK